MSHTPHLQRHRNAAYDPHETKVDLRVRCAVCGFAGIDPLKWQELEEASLTVVTTGTTYAIPAGTAVESIASTVDVTKVTNIGTYSGCPFCGSPRWADGSAPDLRW